MDPRLLTAVIVVVGVPGVLVGYVIVAEFLLRYVPGRLQARIRPWLWMLPALAFLVVFLIYPTVITIIRSFQNRFATAFVGVNNYTWFFTSPAMLTSLKNSLIWLVGLTVLTVGLGLAIAVLVDRVRYERVAKTVIFLPLAISAVAASVIWTFMFYWVVPGNPQVGTLNGIFQVFGAGPFAFLQIDTLSLNVILMVVVMAWMWTGFAMVILSAAYKGISPELLEAARVDGANEWQVFRGIVWPLLLPTVAVVSTTMIITALKAFDLVYVMTSGNFNTQTIAFSMIQELSFGNLSHAAAVAVVLLLAIIPVMAINIRRFQVQEAIR